MLIYYSGVWLRYFLQSAQRSVQGETTQRRVRYTTYTVLRSKGHHQLQALIYDVLPPTTAVTDYAIGLERLSANGQFLVGAQMAITLQQTAHIISGVCFITAHDAYASTNTTKIV